VVGIVLTRVGKGFSSRIGLEFEIGLAEMDCSCAKPPSDGLPCAGIWPSFADLTLASIKSRVRWSCIFGANELMMERDESDGPLFEFELAEMVSFGFAFEPLSGKVNPPLALRPSLVGVVLGEVGLLLSKLGESNPGVETLDEVNSGFKESNGCTGVALSCEFASLTTNALLGLDFGTDGFPSINGVGSAGLEAIRIGAELGSALMGGAEAMLDGAITCGAATVDGVPDGDVDAVKLELVRLPDVFRITIKQRAITSSPTTMLKDRLFCAGLAVAGADVAGEFGVAMCVGATVAEVGA
jgi:hypothetical protein